MSQNNSATDVVRPIISPINNSDSSTDRQGQDDPPPNGDSLPQPPVPPQPPENPDENPAQPPAPIGNDFPSILTCPISQEPPARPVTFLGHRQVFEHSHLWRYIKSVGTRVKHPTTRQRVERVSAIGQIALASDPDRSRILQERIAMGLGPEEDDPLSSDERTSYFNAMGHSTLPPPPASQSNNNTQPNPNRTNIQANVVPRNISSANFPNRLICPITMNPPADARSFTSDSDQLFEYSAIYRMIATRGTLASARFVFHPLTREKIRRDLALEHVHPVCSAMQSMLKSER